MTPEEKKRKEEEERAKFVSPTMVPMPPRPPEPQIQQRQQDPSIPRMFGDMMKAKIMEKAVTTAMGLPFMRNGGVVFDLRVLPPRLRSEYIQRSKSGMGHDEIIRLFESRAGKPRDYMKGTIQRYNNGGSVPYFQIGGNSGKYPGGLSPAGMIRQFMGLKELDDAVKSKGRGESPIPNPKMPALGAPGPRMVRAEEGQKIPKSFVMPEFKPRGNSNKDESYFQRFERTGQLGTGIPNVYVTPQRKGAMISYERNDVLPFTSIWNMMFNKSMKEAK